VFQIPLITLLSIGVIWKGTDLARSPHDRALRLLVSCLLMVLTGEVLSFSGLSSAIDDATATGVGKVVFNAIYMSGLCALILFFASCADDSPLAYRRRQRADFGLLAAVTATLTLAMIATPAAMRGHSLGTPDMAEPAVASFYLVGNAYFVYAYLTSARWAARFARRASRHLAPGLWTMALGLLGLTLTSLNRMVLVALRINSPGSHEEFNAVNWSAANWAMGFVLAGTCCSACVHLITRWRSAIRHRHMYHQLTPLWTALSTAYPEIVLAQEPTGALRQHTHEQRFLRRLVECRDGLMRLSPHLAQLASETDLSHGPADRLARHIAEALELKAASRLPDSEPFAVRIAAPATDGPDADAHELIAVSCALNDHTANDDRTANRKAPWTTY